MSGLSEFQTGVVRQLREAADVFEERGAVYKDNYAVVGRVMEALFPDGRTISSAEEWNKWHLFELAIVKLTRYTNNFEAGHADSLTDMIVYLTMVSQLDAQQVADDIEEQEPFASENAAAREAFNAPSSEEITSIQTATGNILHVGQIVKFKQHLNQGANARITKFDPAAPAAEQVWIESLDGSTGSKTSPAWLIDADQDASLPAQDFWPMHGAYTVPPGTPIN